MHWVLQDGFFSDIGWQKLLETLQAFGIPHSTHKVVPFVGTLIPEPVVDHTNVICFGSYSMRHAATLYGWNPGVFDIIAHDFNVQKSHWGEMMLNHDSEVMEFKDVRLTKAAFVRPIDDTKFFSGKVFEDDEFHEWQHKVCALGTEAGISLSQDTLVQVSPIKRIYAEYRFWIVNRKIVTASRYKLGDTVLYSADVDRRFHQFVGDLIGGFPESLQNWVPADAFVIDVCDTPDGIKIVEINTINAAGFYAGDVQKIVMALEDAYGR